MELEWRFKARAAAYTDLVKKAKISHGFINQTYLKAERILN